MNDLLLMASLGLPRNGLVLLADPYRDAYGLDEAGRAALQTGVDYSGRGNTLTFGASTNAGADDPANSGTAWTFGGDDFLGTPDLGNGDLTAYTVFKTAESPVGASLPLWGRNNVQVVYVAATDTLTMSLRDNTDNTRSVASVASLSKNKWYVVVARLSSAGGKSLSVIGGGSLGALEYTLHPTWGTYGDYLGRAYTSYMEGSIAYHAFYNWVHPDNLAMRCRNSIKSLMAPRGIAL